jgi:hypothetical protein
VVCGDSCEVLAQLSKTSVDLPLLDPPDNLTKRFGAETFRVPSVAQYEAWLDGWFVQLPYLLNRKKRRGSIGLIE